MSHGNDVTLTTQLGTPRAGDARPCLEPFELQQDAMGQWVLQLQDGTVHERVVPVRAFPIASPREGIAIMSREGREILWIDQLDAVPEPQRASVELALQGREFLPEILCLTSVSSFATPSVWRVKTSRGDTELVLKGEEDIRRLTANTLIVSDAHGVQYLIRHLAGMDRHSRKLLDRFL
jgi:Domain of unknown function (DUF1854)